MSAAGLLVVARSAIFLVHGDVSFDSDQAITGLMAKHVMERRAFPLFLYGQNYVFAVEAWLAAVAFSLVGVSIAALKLPLLAINVVIGLLLLWLLRREAGLAPGLALLAAVFFLLPPVSTSATFLEAMGGNVEPLLYVLLLWLTRRRPAWFGLVAGIGFLQRELVAFGVLGMFLVELAAGELWHRDGWIRWFERLRVSVVVWLAVQWLRQFSNPAGPDTTMASLHAASNDIAEVVGRVSFDPSMFATGLYRLVTVHWSALFGTGTIPLSFFVNSDLRQGVPGLGIFLAAVFVFMGWRVLAAILRERSAALKGPRYDCRGLWQRQQFCLYLVLVGSCSALTYALGRGGSVSELTLRYDLLSVLGAVGLTGLFLALEPSRRLRQVAAATIVAWALSVGVAHATLWTEYSQRPPVNAKRQIARGLEALGIKYALADYWICYYVTFLTNERVIVGSSDLTRIPAYDRAFVAHRAEAVRIQRTSCGGGRQVAGVYFCPP